MPLLLLNRARSEACCGGDDDAITRDDAMRRGARPAHTAQRGGGGGRGKKLTDNPPARRSGEGRGRLSLSAPSSAYCVLRCFIVLRGVPLPLSCPGRTGGGRGGQPGKTVTRERSASASAAGGARRGEPSERAREREREATATESAESLGPGMERFPGGSVHAQPLPRSVLLRLSACPLY